MNGEQADALLTEHPLRQQLAATAVARQAAQRALFRAHLDEPALTAIRDALNRSLPPGAERLREPVTAALGRPVRDGKSREQRPLF